MAQFNADILFSVKSKNVEQATKKLENQLTKINNKVNVLTTNLDAATQKLKNMSIPDKSFALAAKQVRELTRGTSRLLDLERRLKAVRESRAARLAGGRTVGTRIRRSELAAGRDIAQNKGEQAAIERTVAAEKARVDALNEVTRATKKAIAADTKKAKSAEQLAAKTAATRRRNVNKGLLEGVGFPLLFGAGPGAILGGGIGGAAGGAFGLGFGAQAIGTSIGGAIDAFVQGAAQLGQALNPLTADISKVVEASGAANTKFSKLVEELESLGRAEEALGLATKRLVALVGADGVDALREFGSDTTALSSEFSKAMTLMSAAVAEVITRIGFLKAVVGELERFNLLKQAETSTNPEIRSLLKRRDVETQTGPFGSGTDIKLYEALTEDIVKLQRELNAEKEVQLQLDAEAVINAALEEKAAERAADAAARKTEQAQNRLTVVEAEIAAARLGNDLTDQNVFNAQKEIILKREKVALSEAGNNKAARELAIAERVLAILGLINRQRSQIDAAAAKAAQEAERLAGLQIRYEQNMKQMQISNAKANMDYSVERARILGGEEAALRKQLEQIDARYVKEIELLAIEQERLLDQYEGLEADKDILKVIKEKAAVIQRDFLLQKSETIAALDRLNVEKEILDKLTQQNRQLELQKSRGATESAQLTLANPFGGPDLERGLQEIQQQVELKERQAAAAASELAIRKQMAGLAETSKKYLELDEQLKDMEEHNKLLEEDLLLRQDLEKAILNQQLALQQLSGVQSALASGLSNIMSSAVQDVVTGTSTVQEAFGNMFKAIGQAFLDMVAQILAQKAVLMLLKAFGGPGATPAATPSPFDYSNLYNQPAVPFASGGYVTRPTPALVGEAGEPEYVIPASKMSGAAQAYNAGARGDDVLSGSHLFSTYNAGNNGGTIFVESTVINNVEYVTMDQARAMTKEAAASGAQRGHGRTMNVLQHSRGQRSRIGMS